MGSHSINGDVGGRLRHTQNCVNVAGVISRGSLMDRHTREAHTTLGYLSNRTLGWLSGFRDSHSLELQHVSGEGDTEETL